MYVTEPSNSIKRQKVLEILRFNTGPYREGTEEDKELRRRLLE